MSMLHLLFCFIVLPLFKVKLCSKLVAKPSLITSAGLAVESMRLMN